MKSISKYKFISVKSKINTYRERMKKKKAEQKKNKKEKKKKKKRKNLQNLFSFHPSKAFHPTTHHIFHQMALNLDKQRNYHHTTNKVHLFYNLDKIDNHNDHPSAIHWNHQYDSKYQCWYNILVLNVQHK